MSLKEIIQHLWAASENKKTCRILLSREPLTRAICPYGICTMSKNQIVLIRWKTIGFTKEGDKADYRNLLLTEIIAVETPE